MNKIENYLVEVVFKGHRRGVFNNRNKLNLALGDTVIVEAERGLDYGVVVDLAPTKQLMGANKDEAPKNVRRKATSADSERDERNRDKERDSFTVCKEQIEYYKLPMKLIEVEQQFDGSKMTFFFTADQRVDFRELVKKLAANFRTRIELRQVGVRDEAKRLGGIGACGRPQCCSEFMTEFALVTTQEAKDQQLSLNPAKISGNCGRLLCCLNYEIDAYRDAYKSLPRSGWKFTPEKGRRGDVFFVDIFKERIHVRFYNDGTQTFEWYDKDQIKKGKVDEVQQQHSRR